MKISLDEFKQQILTDYKLTIAAQTTDAPQGCIMGQVALSKYITKDDSYIALCTDKAYELRTKHTPIGSTMSATFEHAIAIQKEKEKIVVCSTSQHIFDAIFDATSLKLPISFIIWNVKDKSNKQRPNSDILKLLSGFSALFGKGINIQAAKGNDYASLCLTIEQQLTHTRTKRIPTVTIIEATDNYADAFAQWITERELFTTQELITASRQSQV